MTWFREFVYPDFAQMLRYEDRLHRTTSAHQTIEVYSTSRFGRMLVIDGAIQLTHADNHIYHEMLVHVPLLAHGCAADVLIVGGGDGGALREALKHPLKRVTLVELDPRVIEVSKTYFPEIAGGVFEDSRVGVVHEDAAVFVRRCDRVFDVIIIDSTDPIGPGGALFTANFYNDCRRLLRKDAAIVLQAGAPVLGDSTSHGAAQAFEAAFGLGEEYIAPVPSYPMGMIAIRGRAIGGWSLSGDRATLERRFRQKELRTYHYTPSVHAAAFEIFPLVSRRRCEEVALADTSSTSKRGAPDENLERRA